MREVSFPVSISHCGDIDVTLELSEKDYNALVKASESGEEDFCDCGKLAKLTKKVCAAAFDEMANGTYDDQEFIAQFLEFLENEYDFDRAREFISENYEVVVSFRNTLESELRNTN